MNEKNIPTLRLSVITVTHNHAAYINGYLKSLLPQVKQLGGEVIIVDNQSDDESGDIIQQYPEVHLYINRERRGFAANNNFGMANARGRYLLLLNPDTEVLPGAIEKLVCFMDNHPEVGLCGAKLFFPDGRFQPSARRFPTLGSVVARRTPFRVLLRNSRFNRRHLMLNLEHNSQPQEVDWLLGACLMVRREILKEVGPFDEGFYLYVEDIDWARRIHKAGWKICYVPTAQIIHHHQAISDKRLLSYRSWLHTCSMVRYTRKYLLFFIPWLSIRDNEMDIWRSANE
jgi:GT2 family glycosyltransferase